MVEGVSGIEAIGPVETLDERGWALLLCTCPIERSAAFHRMFIFPLSSYKKQLANATEQVLASVARPAYDMT